MVSSPSQAPFERAPDDWPTPHTKPFSSFIQDWSVVVVWDKDHTMVNSDNVLRPKLLDAILRMQSHFPSWTHVIMTENTYESALEMVNKAPELHETFRMILCYDNYFSKAAVRQYFRAIGHWWLWGRKVRRERIKRRERRVNDLFIGKKVVLIDDLQAGRIPNHSCVIPCKVWEGHASSPGELDWPDRIEDNILAILRQLYNYRPVPMTPN